MQGAVFFLLGSANIFSLGKSGNCFSTMETYSSEVTM